MQLGLSKPGSTWYMLRLGNMSTINREWVALHSVQDLKFRDILLSAKVSEMPRSRKLLIPQVGILPWLLFGQCTDACICSKHA